MEQAIICEAMPTTVDQLEGGDVRIEFLVHGLTRDGRRYYPRETLERAVTNRVFEGKKMYVNHAAAGQQARDLRDWAATIREGTVECIDGRLRAIAHVHSPELQAILADPVARKAVGLSHQSHIVYRPKTVNGKTVDNVAEITQCMSIDWVPDGNAWGRVAEAQQAAVAAEMEASEMDITALTIEELRERRPDLIEAVVAEHTTTTGGGNMADTTAEAMAALEAQLAELQTQHAALVAENAAYKAAEEAAQRNAQIAEAVAALEQMTDAQRAIVSEHLVALGDIEDIPAEATRFAEKLRAAVPAAPTRVQGAGTTVAEAASDASSMSDYEERYKRECERRGLPYVPLKEAS